MRKRKLVFFSSNENETIDNQTKKKENFWWFLWVLFSVVLFLLKTIDLRSCNLLTNDWRKMEIAVVYWLLATYTNNQNTEEQTVTVAEQQRRTNVCFSSSHFLFCSFLWSAVKTSFQRFFLLKKNFYWSFDYVRKKCSLLSLQSSVWTSIKFD